MLYEFTELQLDREEFDNLVFMNAPPWWKREYHSERRHNNPDLTEGQAFLLKLCGKTLKEVVQKVIEKSELNGENSTSTAVLEKLGMKAKHKRSAEESEPWFKPYADLSRCFNKERIPPIWIRNLSSEERNSCPDRTYYIEDGNHRALVYALRLELKEEDTYNPFDAIHGTSWDIATGVLGFHPQRADVLENKGILPHKKRFKKGARLPIGIRVDLYERG